MKGHYTSSEAAEGFGISMQTIYSWMRSGKLRAVKIGKSWYIPKKAVSDLLENGDSPARRNDE